MTTKQHIAPAMERSKMQRREDLRQKLAEAPEGTLALFYELMDTARSDFGTTTRKFFQQLCEESDIQFEQIDSGTPSEPGSTMSDPPSPPAGQKMVMEKAAIDFDERSLAKATLHQWREKLRSHQEDEAMADRYDEWRVTRKHFTKLQTKFDEARDIEEDLEHRLHLFQNWHKRRIVERCLRSWILCHRENSLRKFQRQLAAGSAMGAWRNKTVNIKEQEMRAEDARDYMAASSALGMWRDKAKQLQGIRKFKKLYLRLKWFKVWQSKTKKSSRARYDQLLKDRYRDAKHRFGMKSARRAFDAWREQTAEIRENERNADAHFIKSQDERIRKTAHDALTNMYLQTSENVENAKIADEHFGRQLIAHFGVLDVNGNWRRHVREVKAMEAKADEYRTIKTQEVARDALRTIRNQSGRTRQMENQADDFYDRHSKRLAQGNLQTWRQKAAERQGIEDISAIPAPPTTPAARRTALFRNVQQ